MDLDTSQRDYNAVPPPISGKRLPTVPYLVSLLVHCGLAAFLWLISNVPAKTPSAYDQLIKGNESRIVFYKLKDKLPDIQPAKSADARPPKALIRIPKQSIVSSPKDAPKGIQMVWQPVPDILPKEVPAPNILALKAAPIAPPERKQFVPPSERPLAARALPEPKLPDAPAQMTVASKLPDQLGAVPKLTMANRARFVAPEARAQKQTPATPEMAAAPAMAMAAAPTAPVFAGMEPGELNIAVVGLNPSEKNAIPKGSRAAEFSAGPKLNPDGGTGGAKGNIATVPDLFVSGGGAATKPGFMAKLNAAPTSAEALRGMSKYASHPEDVSPAAAAHLGAAHVSSAPNPRFDGREVYTMAIQMPNITSYVGSWLMWYSGRGGQNGTGPVSPPVPHRKVDPKYIATAAEERIEGRVQLLCVIRQNGFVDNVELVRGIDDRLDRSAMDALSKWQFVPASRGGVPVDVDVMVEIPFRLAPRIKR